MSGFVGAQHEFHDAAFVQGWADRFVPSPSRLALFDLILGHVSTPELPNRHVLELGVGPGYMARHILERNDAISYEGLDFSEVFFDVARNTIGSYMSRVRLTKADLMDQAWPKSLTQEPAAIISTWALHDLGCQQAVADVYVRCHVARSTRQAGHSAVSVSDLIKRRGAIARKAAAGARETQVKLRAQVEQRVIDGERRSTQAALARARAKRLGAAPEVN